jgi:glycerate dehydrogenase
MMIKKNIVVLDGYTLNPGDLDWSELRSLGLCTIHNRTLPDEIIHRANEAEIVLTNKTVLSKEILEQLPRLRYIGVLATGYNVVDIAAAKKLSITVTNVPAYSTHSVAQTVFALLLELTHHAGHHSAEVRNGRWSANPDFSFWDFPLVELRGKTFGIVGYGNIGQAVARIAAAFEMNVVISTRTARTSGDSFTDTETLLKTSDIVSLHCSLNDETQNLINAKRLAIMKPSAYLINTGRGGLIDEYALANALNNELLAGAGLDVLSIEPPKDNPLLSAKNCIVTPHIAWASRSARERLMDAVVHNVQSFIEGKPVNVVS